MTTSVIPFDPSKLGAALKRSAAENAPKGSFIKMSKGGVWTHGADETEISDTDEFLVNPQGVMHGWVCWADTEAGHQSAKLGEFMAPVTEPAPVMPSEIPATGAPWAAQLGVHLKSTDGVELFFATTSYGGKKAVAGLMDLMAAHYSDPKNFAKPVPVVTLSSEWYKHQKYGKLFNPIITIKRWVAMPASNEKAAAKPALKAPAKKKAK